MKILVTGAKGQLGTDVMLRLEELGIDCVGAGHEDFDITDPEACDAFISSAAPDVVIHCAAYTAVDRAESERELCRKINVDGSGNVASACEKAGAACLYISTDYVFGGDGETPYEVNDGKNPVNFYGLTKLEGENAVLSSCSRCYIVRVSWIFGHHGANFVETMLRLGASRGEVSVVNDQIGSPTFTEDLAKTVCEIAVSGRYGVYHATNEGFCSWAEFAAEIMKEAGLNCRVKPIPSSEYPTAAARPKNSRLSKAFLDEAGVERLPSWQDALRRYIAER